MSYNWHFSLRVYLRMSSEVAIGGTNNHTYSTNKVEGLRIS